MTCGELGDETFAAVDAYIDGLFGPSDAVLDRALERAREAGLADRVEVRVGPALDLPDRLSSEGAEPSDLVFIDADEPPYAECFDAAIRLGRPGTPIVADNVVRGGEVLHPEGDEAAEGAASFNELAAQDPRIATAIVQQVGSKGHDRVALSVVREPS